jgi:hypothetical protein
MTARSIVKSLGGMWTGSYALCRCVCHDDRKPSLKIKDDPNKFDGIDLVCFAGCDWREIKAELARRGLLVTAEKLIPKSRRALRRSKVERDVERDLDHPARNVQFGDDITELQQRISYALKLWEQSVPLTGNGRRYFTLRRKLHVGLLDDLSHCLRWHEGGAGRHCADD